MFAGKKSKKDKKKEMEAEEEENQMEAEVTEVVKVEPKVVTMEDLEDEDDDDRKKKKKKGKKEDVEEKEEGKEEEEGTMKTAAQKRKEKKEREKQKKLVWSLVLTFTTLWVNSKDDKLIIFFLIFPRKQDLTFMQIVSIGDNLHEMSKPVFWEKKKKKIFKFVVCWKFYPAC